MPKVLLRNINPLGYVDLPLIGRQGATDDPDGQEPGSGCLIPGEVFAVDAEVAGVGPFWRPATRDDNVAIERGHVEYRHVPADDPDSEFDFAAVEVRDLGHGLLSQVENFELAADELDKKSIDDLRVYAAAQDPPVDLTGLSKKADILAAIRKG